MNLLLFFITFNLILAGRLGLTFKDERADVKTICKISVLPFFVLPFFAIGPGWFMLLTYLLLFSALMYLLEKNVGNVYACRLGTLFLHAAVLAFIFSPAAGVEPAGYFQQIIEQTWLQYNNHLLMLQLYLFGALLVMNEMNTTLRYLMNMLNLTSIGEKEDPEKSITMQEYNTGRVIGMLERLFIYAFTLAGQFAAIGFILTAKGVIRYREFEDRTFAEYVLIGTLLSALLAMGTALLVSLFL